MANLMKNEPKGYGAQMSMKGSLASDMKSGEQGMAKKGIPNAMSNKMPAGNECTGGKSSGVCYTHDRKCYQD
jgi:hypothetical protein